MASDRVDRRTVIRYAAGATAAAMLAPLAACSSSGGGGAKDHPAKRSGLGNILVLYSDDQRWDTLQYMPTLRRLQEQGTTFTQARQSTSLCSPSRATLLRGQMAVGPHGHGVQGNTDELTKAQVADSLAPWLDAEGYYCGLVGKYFDQFEARHVAPGWSWWRALIQGKNGASKLGPIQDAYDYGVFDGTRSSYPKVHQMEHHTALTLDFIDRAPEPWFLWDCPTSPHYPPQPTDRRKNAPVETSWPVVGNDTSTKPSWMAELPPPLASTVATERSDIENILREVIDVDDHLAAIWDRLRSKGHTDRTTLIYCSDNGTAFVDYRLDLYAKNLPYDVSSRVPLIGVGSAFPAGHQVDAPVSAAIDITATCVELAKAKATVPQDGVSLLATAAGHDDPQSRVVPGSCKHLPEQRLKAPTSRWVVADRGSGLRKLIAYEGASSTDQYEAYDLDTDPHELTNWANDPTRVDERNDLIAALHAVLR